MRPLSTLTLFRVLLGIRWAVLLSTVIVELLVERVPFGHQIWYGIAAAFVYTLVLTILSKPVLAAHLRSPVFAVVDMVVVMGLYAVSHEGAEPFFLYSATTILFTGLYGSVPRAILSAVVWNALAVTVQLLRGIPARHVFDIVAMEDLFNLCMIGALWAYSIGLGRKLTGALDELQQSKSGLEAANAALDDRDKQIVSMLDLGEALLAHVDAAEIARIVVDALTAMHFGPTRVWILEGGVLRTVRPEVGLDVLRLDSAGPVTTVLRSGRPETIRVGDDDPVPGVPPGTLALILPVAAGDDVLGVMVVESLSGEPFLADEMEMLDLFADQVALGLRHVRSYGQGRDLAVAQERNRITQDMHDTVVQKVYGASLILDSLRKEDVPKAISDELATLQTATVAALKSLRFAVLNWDSLEWEGDFPEVVERYSDEYAALTGIRVELSSLGEGCRLSASRAKDLLAILQEALSNVWRHSGSATATVDLEMGLEGMSLAVSDRGGGFDEETIAGGATPGITGMAARGARYGGSVKVESRLGQGTRVSAWMPC